MENVLQSKHSFYALHVNGFKYGRSKCEVARKKSYFVKKIIKHITPNFKLKQDDLEGHPGFLCDTA